jgi:hypothetical protein
MTSGPKNPYTAPKSRLSTPDKPGSAFKAVGLGLAVDIGGTIVASVAFTFVYGIVLYASGMSPEDIAQFLGNPVKGSFADIAGEAIGIACSGLGGFVCARIAKRSELKLGAIQAVLSTLIVIAFAIQSEFDTATLVGAILNFGAVISGAQIGQARNRRTSAGT